MAEQQLIFPSIKDAEGDGFPAFADVFDADPMLAQHQMWLAYWTKNVALFDAKPHLIPGLMARVYRIYPSLVREYHGYLLLDDCGDFDLVLRGRKLDAAGVDYLILNEGKAWGVQAYVDTPRSRMFRGRKKARHKTIGEQIELPLRMEEAEQIGPFSVYGQQHLDLIRSIVSGVCQES